MAVCDQSDATLAFQSFLIACQLTRQLPVQLPIDRSIALQIRNFTCRRKQLDSNCDLCQVDLLHTVSQELHCGITNQAGGSLSNL